MSSLESGTNFGTKFSADQLNLSYNVCLNPLRSAVNDRLDDDLCTILHMVDRHQGRASRTDTGRVLAFAAPANSRLATLSRCFRPAVSDQLVDQAAIRRDVKAK